MNLINVPDNFYPTPKSLIDKMTKGILWKNINCVLEPSAGTGNIVKEIIKNNTAFHSIKVDCIEKDPEIRTLLQHYFSDRRYQEMKSRVKSICNKESEYNEYIDAVEMVNKGNLSEWQKSRYIPISQNVAFPLTESEKLERELLKQEIEDLEGQENVRVVHDDFLNFNTHKKYDLIIMNPPFDRGDLHLLHALELQERGGKVVCLLNAETIKNPYTKSRQLLKRKLEEYNATIKILDGEFTTDETERKTSVEVALISVDVPRKQKESFIIKGLRKATEENHKENNYEAKELTSGNWIKLMADQFNFELEAIRRLADEYFSIKPYILSSFEEDCTASFLNMTVDGHSVDYYAYVEAIRKKYWNAFFKRPEFIKLLTSDLREKYDNVVKDMVNYDFTEYNAYTVMEDLMKNLSGSMEDTILNLFETLTAKYSWFSESDKNIHYYNGWKTNKAWIINKKVIIPMNGAFSYDYFYKKYDEKFNFSKVYSVLLDIEKTLSYLDGGKNTDTTDLESVLKYACEKYINRKIECKYFTITVYKKGTCHIEFKDLDLLMKLNLYGSQRKGWLPPCYGKKAYKDMTKEEKIVIDSFQGEKSYNEVMTKSNYYLAPVSGNQLLMLGG